MGKLFSLIGRYKEDLTTFPIVCIAFILLTIIAYIVGRNKKKFKYVPALVAFVLSLFLLLRGFMTITKDGGLDSLLHGVYVFAAAWISLGTAWMIALLDSMHQPSDKMKTKTGKKTVQKKVPAQPARASMRPPVKSRAAKPKKGAEDKEVQKQTRVMRRP